MEQVLDSIRVPCPHAAHGCAERLAYHDRDGHARTCTHKPCHCPVDGCDFAGPVHTTLLEHFAAVHGWPCSTGSTWGSGFDVSLHKGFNIVVVAAGADFTTATTEQLYTLVLNVEQAAPVCNAITAFCIHPCHTGTVEFGFSYYRRWRRDSDNWQWRGYVQASQLEVVCTDLSNGMPGPSSCLPFVLPRWPAAGGEDDDDIRVKVNYVNPRGT
jgi:E3 ubiquitin-protein ligase SIAH1